MLRFGVICIALSAALFATSAVAGEWFVAPDGNDQHPGSQAQPFATLARARDAVRADQSGAPATVWLRGGTYFVAETLTFGAADSGTEGAPITYRAFANEQPVLVGGRPLRSWTPWQGKVLRADAKAAGVSGRVQQLFFAGRRQHLARYPNFNPDNPYGGGWAYVDGTPIPMYQDVPGESQRSLQYRESDARRWARPTDVEVFVFPRYNWWNNIVRVASIDTASRTITLASDCSYPIRPGDRYYFQGALEDLDAPGEWAYDEPEGVVYFWPPDDAADANRLGQAGQEIVVPAVRTIISADKAEHLTFRGLTFECAEDAAISFKNTRHCEVVGCTIRNVGHYRGAGVSVSGGDHNAVIGCDIHDVGSHGIAISGGDRKTLTPAENVADNNYIHHMGVDYKQGVGISLTGVGNRASHNLIHDGPRMGIQFSGNNLVLEYNHIRHVNLETEDTGAVYTGGRDWISSRGTVIRHNYFHDILGYGRDSAGRWASPHFAWGVYLDDNTGGVDVIGNIVARCSRAGLHLHNGRDNRIEGNVFADNGQQQFEYSGWRPDQHYWKDHFPTMVQGYESVANEPAWRSMRNMQLHPRDAVLPDGTIMSGNVFERNIVAWQNDAKLLAQRNVSFAHNAFDHNLYFHFGRPIETGFRAAGKATSPNLCPNGSFESGRLGQLPQDWQWQIRPPQAGAGVVATKPAQGKQVLRIDAAFDASKPRDNYPILVTRDLPLKLGGLYGLKAKLRGTEPDGTAKLMLQSYVAKAYFWASSPSDAPLTTDWKQYEFLFHIPAAGETGHHPEMKLFRVRIDFPDRTGSLFVDDVQLHELASIDEWAGWQQQGNDLHSLVADPQFEDFAHDDFRLKSTSPALRQLKFEPIPVDRIGPYADERRASWPIVEAAGVREHPLTPPTAAAH